MRTAPFRSIFQILPLLEPLVFCQFKPSVPIETRSLDEIYAQAQKEQCTLNVVGGGDAIAQYAPIVSGFETRFPQVPLNLTVDVSKYQDAKIDRAFMIGKETVDVVLTQQLNDLSRWKAENRLLYYKPANFTDIVNGFRDPDGAFLPALLFSFGSFYYDYTKLSAADVPKTFNDLLDPKWKGKIVSAYPTDDDAINYLYSLIISKYGFAWLDAFSKQDVLFVRGTAAASQIVGQSSLANGTNTIKQRVLTFTTAENYTFAPNIATQAPQDDYPSWWQPVAIIASTKCPDSAKLFVSWLLSDKFQQPFSQVTTTPLNHLNLASGNDVALSNFTQAIGYESFIRDREMVEWWRFQYETTIGPPQGPDPVSVSPGNIQG